MGFIRPSSELAPAEERRSAAGGAGALPAEARLSAAALRWAARHPIPDLLLFTWNTEREVLGSYRNNYHLLWLNICCCIWSQFAHNPALTHTQTNTHTYTRTHTRTHTPLWMYLIPQMIFAMVWFKRDFHFRPPLLDLCSQLKSLNWCTRSRSDTSVPHLTLTRGDSLINTAYSWRTYWLNDLFLISHVWLSPGYVFECGSKH